MTLAERLKWGIGNKEGMTPARLARASGVTKSWISQILDGTAKELKAITAFRLAAALELDAEWLATGKGARTSAERYVDLDKESRDSIELLRAIQAMPPSHRNALIAMILPKRA